MKKLIIAVLAIFGTITAQAQTERKIESKVEKTETKKEVKKEVKMEDVNGEQTLTISTTEGGKTNVEVFKGTDAEVKMKELESQMNTGKVTQDVNVTEENGVKVVKIIRNENGKVTEEVYKGADADQKLKELEMNPASGKTMHIEEQRIEKKKTHNE